MTPRTTYYDCYESITQAEIDALTRDELEAVVRTDCETGQVMPGTTCIDEEKIGRLTRDELLTVATDHRRLVRCTEPAPDGGVCGDIVSYPADALVPAELAAEIDAALGNRREGPK